MFHVKHYDVIVIGAGHAGVEAAAAAGRARARVALVTMAESDIGALSCNPAVGGLGKGHLVREVDAMDGLIGRIADQAGIQYRLLNRRKGPAVQGPRAQMDRVLYAAASRSALRQQPEIDVIFGEVTEIQLTGNRCTGVVLGEEKISAGAVILTTGTFLNGVIHIGQESRAAGRMGDGSAKPLAQQLLHLGLPMGRLKTGTPPRLLRRSIDWNMLEQQPGDDDPSFLSFLTTQTQVPQISCAITHTNQYTHDIIQKNLEKSAMYGGKISGRGPRYCPSIEDKIVRFADKQSHQVFLEPEGLESDRVYPNGISTSLPADVQLAYVRTMEGCAKAEIVQPGYAVEYDFIQPTALYRDLQLKAIEGLYFAGQINGTTGYEEAAAQGLVAGLNAARAVQGLPLHIFGRADSYIGVMLDDLVTKGVTEPYRMFTSRAEYRLTLRADNADQRLTPIADQLGILTEGRRALFESKMDQIAQAKSTAESVQYSPQKLASEGIEVRHDGVARSVLKLLATGHIDIERARKLHPGLSTVQDTILTQIVTDTLYEQYTDRQKRDVDSLRRDMGLKIPLGFDYASLSGFSAELRAKAIQIQPSDIAALSSIEGMTPAAVALVASALQSKKRSA
ncbi:tRNA uridine-5-carboxymethylaminomethyl(34) synthesis enzyme MnmG [Paracoccus jiaweipingae]|uniref:tRNA uridine-5-carboxymethylaminomethyl(34) synthesis enzyme MnmG n=1 Tax=unclassified Paracoccus (in: a-proteobacteria) TaxID=2688777 RepID=UPI0037BA6C5C